MVILPAVHRYWCTHYVYILHAVHVDKRTCSIVGLPVKPVIYGHNILDVVSLMTDELKIKILRSKTCCCVSNLCCSLITPAH